MGYGRPSACEANRTTCGPGPGLGVNCASPEPQVHRQHLRGILEAVAQSAHYPDSSSAPALDLDSGGPGGGTVRGGTTPEALQAREAEAAAAERRQELFVLFRNASKVGF